jgi:hypothetical protein
MKTSRGHAWRGTVVGALLWLIASPACAQANHATVAPVPESQPTITPGSNLVLVPAFVYDPARLRNAPKEELPCARATVAAFSSSSPHNPMPKDCHVTEVHSLKAADFRIFEDGADQRDTHMRTWIACTRLSESSCKLAQK